MPTNINIDASSKQDYLGQDVNDAITNADNPSAINPFLTASQIVGGLPTGAIPSNYVTRMSSLEISSPTFIDVPSLSTTVTVTAAVKAYCLFSFEASATGADAQIEFKVVVNGETSDIVMVDFAKASNSNGSINFRTTNNLSIGSHVVKVQARKVNGNKIASLDKGFLFTFALQAPKGETGAGVPIGGTTNQVLSKIDGSDYNTQFTTIDKTFVGLGNVDNTSDANKPISTATQTALDGKQATLVSGTNIKTINGASVLGSGDLTVGGSSSLDIGTTPIINGTVGRIPFQGAGDVIQQDSGLFWDNVNKRIKLRGMNGSSLLSLIPQSISNNFYGIHFDITDTGTSIRGQLDLNPLTGEIRFGNVGGGGYFPTIYSNGARVVTFATNGNIGFHQNTPTARFHVKAADATSAVVARVENSAGTGDLFNVTGQGKVGVLQAAPTARLHLPAGTASATTAPIKLTAGTNLTTPEAGAIEFNGTDLFFTNGALERRALGYTTLTTDELGAIQNASSPSGANPFITVSKVTGVDILVGGWSLVGSYYEVDVAEASITNTSIVDVIPDNASVDLVKAAEILPSTLSNSGSVKIYAKNIPTGTITVTLNIFK